MIWQNGMNQSTEWSNADAFFFNVAGPEHPSHHVTDRRDGIRWNYGQHSALSSNLIRHLVCPIFESLILQNVKRKGAV